MPVKHGKKAATVTEFKTRFGPHVAREHWAEAWDNWLRLLWQQGKVTTVQRKWINPFTKIGKDEQEANA